MTEQQPPTQQPPTNAADRPIAVLIAALGGEGGGVLTEWLVAAAMASDLPVQSISTPGVAQRTGATTYYVEIYPKTHADLDGKRPVLALYPSPGNVDIMVASELIEAGRALENGYVSPDRTALIAATHRVYAVTEKSAMADGRFNAERVLRAAREMADHPILFDLTRRPETRGLILNSVLLGAISGSGKLPIAEETFRQSIRQSGKMVEANLTAFDYGLKLATAPPADLEPQGATDAGAEIDSLPKRPRSMEQLIDRAAKVVPGEALTTVEIGLERTADWQDLRYARAYLERLAPVIEVDKQRGAGRSSALTAEVARRLALWMAYEDLIRVADLKTRGERTDKVRQEVRAKDHEPVNTTEFFKPGIEEVAALMPGFMGRPVKRWADRRGLTHKLHLPLHLNSASISGYTMMWTLARMRKTRRWSARYGAEQEAIDIWLSAVVRAAQADYDFALEAARLPRLIKGYSDTFRRGWTNFNAIFSTLVLPALDNAQADLAEMTERIAKARQAALADPDGVQLGQYLEPIGPRPSVAAE